MNLVTLIKQVRYTINDLEESGFPRDQLVMYLSDALKFLRRTILIERPELLEEKALVAVVDQKVVLPKSFIKVISVSDGNGNKFSSSFYELRLPKTIDFEENQLSLKDGDILKIEYVPEFEAITGYENDYPLPSDFSQAIVEYTAIRAQLRNEFNMSGESDIFKGVHQQIVMILRSMRSDGQRISGYWQV